MINTNTSNKTRLGAGACLFLLRCGVPFKDLWCALTQYYSSSNHDVLPDTPYPLAHRCVTSHYQTITKCEYKTPRGSRDWRLNPSNDSAAKLIPTPTEWLMTFPEPQFIPSLARVCEGACVCGVVCVTVEVIISSGRRDVLVPVVVPWGAVLGRDSQLVPFNSPPFCSPLNPPPLSLPHKLHSVNLLFPFEEVLLWIPHFWHLGEEGKSKEVLVV